MVRSSELIIAYGPFSSDDRQIKSLEIGGKEHKIDGKKPEERLESLKKIKESVGEDKFNAAVEKTANQDWAEVARDQFIMTDYPKPITRYYMGLESWHQSIEPFYFWCTNFLGDIGFPVIDKITDLFTASEHSSFYGAAGQRLGLAQDKAAQFLATIGKMIKDMFQLVRELRWIDERLEYYRDSIGIDKEGKKTEKGPSKSAETALKGMWVDLVDGVVGGQRTGANLFVMAQQLQFTTLPDLFFAVNAMKKEEVDKAVEEQAKEFNLIVKTALKRKLYSYIAWKQATFEEMKGRRKFTLDYLRQHYQIIRMYSNWIKPYLRHIERLSTEQRFLESPRLIAAFESSMVEVEILARKLEPGYKDVHVCILMNFEYFTKPSMLYTGEGGYHRGPVHVGATRITWRSYAWSKEQIKNYIDMKNREDLELLASIDKSLKDAMDSLGTDIVNYISEAEKGKKEEEVPEKPKMDVMEPFTAVGKGMIEVFGSLVPKMPKFGGKKAGGEDVRGAETVARKLCWLHYNIFKKAHGLLSW